MCLKVKSCVEFLALGKASVDDAHGIDLCLYDQLHVGQAVDVLIEHVLDTFLSQI